ncbi:MAG: hypothetical protein HS099_03475 [Ardenticatenaceae bacterium]|nr:hypothetical protein [Ardenticatenaceae bacterium]MBE7528779.1 hypothetical protein [Ardenticatenaceae bacterium]
MSKLIDVFNQMLRSQAETCESLLEAERRLSETLAFSDFDEIMHLLNLVHENYPLEYPVWAHLVTYRLACLLQPQNAEIRRQAAFWIRYFGPDWDDEADRLEDEARKIEGKYKSH